MRTHGHRKGSTKHWGLLWGPREGQLEGWWGGQGGITWGVMPDVGDAGTEAANHIAMCVPVQQSCMICTCTPEPKVQLKKYIYICDKNTKISWVWWHTPVDPATWEAETPELLLPGRRKLQ